MAAKRVFFLARPSLVKPYLIFHCVHFFVVMNKIRFSATNLSKINSFSESYSYSSVRGCLRPTLIICKSQAFIYQCLRRYSLYWWVLDRNASSDTWHINGFEKLFFFDLGNHYFFKVKIIGRNIIMVRRGSFKFGCDHISRFGVYMYLKWRSNWKTWNILYTTNLGVASSEGWLMVLTGTDVILVSF